jgi:L-gulonate 5-dehydrogenase
MRAAVTEGVGSMVVVDRPDPGEPGPGEVLVVPEAVGICGSDYSFFSGHLSEAAGGSSFPRVQGHEVGGRIAAVGPGCRAGLAEGMRVSLMPLSACGHCYPCGVGRENVCVNFRLIGIHVDGGLQGALRIGQDQVFPIEIEDGALAAMTEPVSVAMRAVHRARLQAGEPAVVLGAGPIGLCVALAALDRGCPVLLVDVQDSRLELARSIGAQTVRFTDRAQVVADAREWSGGAGPPVAVDATGVPGAVRAMVDMVAPAGRAVQVGMSVDEVSLRIGSLTEKEIDLLGVCCMNGGDFAEAVGVVERYGDTLSRLISHRFALEQAPDAIRFAIDSPTSVMKVVIGGE